jgi:hypothetical protein
MKSIKEYNVGSCIDGIVLLIVVIYEVHYYHCLRWHDIHTKLHENWFRYSGNIDFLCPPLIYECIYIYIYIFFFFF